MKGYNSLSLWDLTLAQGTIVTIKAFPNAMELIGLQMSLSAILNNGREFVDVNGTVTYGGAPLLSLLKHGPWSVDMVTLLLKQGAKTAHTTKNGRPLLHYAIMGSQHVTLSDLEQVLYLFLAKGSDPKAMDENGVTVSQVSCCKNALYLLADCDNVFDHHHNTDLKLRQVWSAALMRAGYTADEVMSPGRGPQASQRDQETDGCYCSVCAHEVSVEHYCARHGNNCDTCQNILCRPRGACTKDHDVEDRELKKQEAKDFAGEPFEIVASESVDFSEEGSEVESYTLKSQGRRWKKMSKQSPASLECLGLEEDGGVSMDLNPSKGFCLKH